MLQTIEVMVEPSKRGSGEAVLKFLHQNSLKQEHRRSIEEINKYIEQERNAWE